MSRKLRLFEGYGIELEYMIVDRDTLAVKPICDEVLGALAGEIVNEVSLGRINVSNELVLHVIEFKCNGPQLDLLRMKRSFQDQVRRINDLLGRWNAQLMPTTMHPLMRPHEETKLWPHGQNAIYASYNRIFDCSGHGWSNLQSIHINLPFQGDEEFGRLHAAIRLALPLLPALAASSPLVEGKMTGKLDNRLDFYSQNQKRISSIIGHIIPERVFSQADYEHTIFAAIKRDIAPHDPEGILEEEWLNSRGAIARFERDAIEIRLLDIQESLAADFAVISLVISLVKSLVEGLWIPLEEQKTFDEKVLKSIFVDAVTHGGRGVLSDPKLLNCFQLHEPTQYYEVWSHILQRLVRGKYPVQDFVLEAQHLLARGTLAEALSHRLGDNPTREEIATAYQQLSQCLEDGRFYG
jgi:gamma-glutamyl:cysteine ligase YbdK (ATP-grasp superfamily)